MYNEERQDKEYRHKMDFATEENYGRLIKSGEEDLPGSVTCHEWMKEGCHLGQCTVILKEQEVKVI